MYEPHEGWSRDPSYNWAEEIRIKREKK